MLKGIKDNLIKIFTLIGVTIVCIMVILLGVVYVMEKGPSKTLTASFCRSVRETSAIRWVSQIFLSDEEIEQYKSIDTSSNETADIDTGLITVSAINTNSSEPEVQVIDISSGTCQGKLMIIKNPLRVRLGINEKFGYKPGLLLTEMVEKYDGLAGINAGGFVDDNGQGDGGTPTGVVIYENEIIYGSPDHSYNIVGLDNDGILFIGKMTAAEAVENGIKWGVSFVTHDGLASSLVINGEVQEQNISGGVNPRTAIGQRSDGALLLLVLDGRSINTLGATLTDVVNIMLEYGAVNVGNLDGGSSSVMVYEGEIINNCSSVTGPRKIPTGFIVLKEGAEID